MGLTELVYECNHLKVILTAYTVAMVTYYDEKMTKTCLPMFRHYCCSN